MKRFNQMLIAITIFALSGVASATEIRGELIFGGDLTFNFDTNSVDILGDDAVLTADGTGDFGALSTGDIAVYNDFIYDPFTPVDPLWSIAGFTFTLGQITYVEEYTSSQGHQYLTLAGNGTFSGNGFDTTSGAWTFSADGVPGDNGTGTFGFSSVNVPEPGIALLLGIGLVGFGVSRKLRKTA